MNQNTLVALRNALVNLYPNAADIRRVVADAGIGVGPISFEGSTVNIWHSVLVEAEKQHQVDQLLAIAEVEYGGNQALQAACRAYRQATAATAMPQTQTTRAQPSHAQPQRRWYLAPTAVLLLVAASGVMWYQGCLPTGVAPSAPPTATSEAAVLLLTEATAISPTATSVVPTDTATPTVLATATLSPTVSTPPTDMPPVPPAIAVGLQVLDEGLTENTYLLNGRDVDLFNIGDDLVVYGEPNPGTEVAIALLKVIGKSQNALTAQAILKHPDVKIRTNMRVDGKFAHLSESQLIPVFDYVVGYLLRPARIRLRPNHGLAVGAQLQALEYERSGGAIIDALRTDTILQITDIGASGAVAAVELIAGEWPVTGTVVSLREAPTPSPTEASQPTATFTVQPVQASTHLPPPTEPATPTPEPRVCGFEPGRTFYTMYQVHSQSLGCPTSSQITISTISEEMFQGGHLFWRKDTDIVYIIYDRQIGGGELFSGTWDKSIDSAKGRYWSWAQAGEPDPDGIGLVPPNGLLEPKRGFGWLWRTHLGRENGRLGWALDVAYGFDNVGQAQEFEQGALFKGSDLKIYGLLNNGQFYASR